MPQTAENAPKERNDGIMDIKTIDHLCNLSKLNYTDEGKEKVMGEMSAIIELMDTVKEFDVVYDDTKDNDSISYVEVIEGVAKASSPTEKVISDTRTSGNCYIVPKMVG